LKNRGLILDSIFFKVPSISILEGVYLETTPGEITALVGRNGTGKSTLLKIAGGQLRATSGITIIDGERITGVGIRQRYHKIGYLPQTSMLPKEMPLRQLLRAIPSAQNELEPEFISKTERQKVRELSGGERRYLELSILLSLNRPYLLLDEPFTGVEPYIIEKLFAKIRRAAESGTGILLTDHQHRYVTEIANCAYLLHGKQCRKLRKEFTAELKEIGYLSS